MMSMKHPFPSVTEEPLAVWLSGSSHDQTIKDSGQAKGGDSLAQKPCKRRRWRLTRRVLHKGLRD